MKSQIHLLLLTATMLAIAASPLRAQIVADGATNTLSNVTNTFTGDVIVGTNGSFTLLVLSDNALLRNSANGVIGLNGTAKSNEVQLLNPSARWLMDGELFVGSNGASSRLIVSNGALVTSFDGVVGQHSASSNNVCLVTVTGSSWQMVGSLDVGYAGGGNRMMISNGGRVEDANGRLGMSGASSNNEVLVTGAGSLWSNRGGLFVGILGGANRLVVSNGGQVVTATISYLGGNAASVSNEVVVTGLGSSLKIGSSFDVGSSGPRNRLLISDGGRVADGIGSLGFGAVSGENLAVVAGSGSVWSNAAELYVGLSSPGNQLVVSNSGVVMASNAVYLGFNFTATDNRIEINGGSLRVTNNSGAGLFDLRRGTNRLNTGLIDVDRLLLTNAQGLFEFKGGTLRTKSTTNDNGQPFTVGNGTSAAAFDLLGGTHAFFNGIVIASNASLIGNGTVTGTLTVQPGGMLAPGDSVGTLILNNSPALQGATSLEISKNGSVLTNDQIQVAGALTYGGTLSVTNIGPDTLILGNRFPLFNASSYAGAFSSITLPPLGYGLAWTNKLLVDGSIEVTRPTISGSVELQAFAGTNRMVRFVASAVSGGTNYLQTNDVTLNFNGGALAAYNLQVPTNTTHISAKTAWNLRRRLPVTFTNGTATVNFTGPNNLRGGDLVTVNGGTITDTDNAVTSSDYLLLLGYYLQSVNGDAAIGRADVDGSGAVTSSDYLLLLGSYLSGGDAP